MTRLSDPDLELNTKPPCNPKEGTIVSHPSLLERIHKLNGSVSVRKVQQYAGATSCFVYQSDKRFSYFLYVPESHLTTPPPGGYDLIVLIHGTLRTVEGYRSAFRDFAEEHQCIVLLPLFPGGITTHLDLDEYKRIEAGGVRYDRLLLGMIEEVAQLYSVRTERFLLHGFSGGGQFAHRFLYLHPNRLAGVSVGAPGSVTLLDEGRPWWVGTGDVPQRFGIRLDPAAISRVPVLLVIGSDDENPEEVAVEPNEPAWMEGVNATGETRRARLEALRDSLEMVGTHTTLAIVDGVAHDGLKVFRPVQDFFQDCLSAMRTEARH